MTPQYNNDYVGSGNLEVVMQETMEMMLTNASNAGCLMTNFFFYANLSSWPGSDWTSATPYDPAPVPGSFIYTNWTVAFLPPALYQSLSGAFILLPTNGIPQIWETNVVVNYPFPQFGYMTTNWAQAFVLDGPPGLEHVIDYVQFSGPNNARNLTTELADPIYKGPPQFAYMWSTNGYGSGTVPTWGEVNQINVSKGNASPPPGGIWSTLPVQGGDTSPAAEAAFFAGFWTTTYMYNGNIYANTSLSVIAPYTPVRTMYDYTLWQANDPLVHYLASDLNYIGAIGTNTVQRTDNYPPIFNVVGQNLSQLGDRFQSWGMSVQMAVIAGIDTNAYNLAFKDPLVWGSDYWDFPTNQTWNSNWLGQVHRGTPWQTIYLKSTNILAELLAYGGGLRYVGTNTWLVWSGAPSAAEAGRTCPVNDWHLAALLAALLNTNASPAFFSVNNPDPNAWAAQLDGLTAWTNSSPYATYTPIVLSSNSPAVAALVNAIASTRASQPGQLFQDVGDLFATPALTVQSPFLDWSDASQQRYGISDAAYEQIPAQMLAFLGADSLGALVSATGGWTVQFTGGAGHRYALQTSADLIHWTTLSTNSPVNGRFNAVLPAPPSGPAQFYRSLLLQ
jgi:hypothetical protein